ncbi:MAG: hypothetical protein ACYTBZ_05005 [Planctomycetota bacterium]|jgi:hypothetical protein
MNEFFRDFHQVIRYLASGMVALAAAHMFNNECLKYLNQNLGASSTWWPVLFLAATIGLLMHAFNATLMWWTFPAMLRIGLLKGRKRDGFRWYNQQRWLRRASANLQLKAIQQEIDR